MRRILIADDSRVMQQLVAALLEETGAELSFASNGTDALVSFRQHRPDLVVSDVEMPGMTGVELARQVQLESAGHTKVVLMSAGNVDAGRAAVERGDAEAFVPKPLDSDELRQAVTRLLPPLSDTDVKRQRLRRVRILIADDTEVGRRLLARLLQADPEIEIVGVVRDGHEAVSATERLRPQLVLLDSMMPGLDGVAATREIMRRSPVPVVLAATDATPHAATLAFEATRAGAVDFLVPPPWGDVQSAAARVFREKLKDLAKVKVIRRRTPAPVGSPTRSLLDAASPRVGLVAICGSTGGPALLAKMLRGLEPALPHVPVLIVQHILSGFVDSFVEWLQIASGANVRVAQDGDALQNGTVLVAPDAHHLVVTSRDRVGVTDSEPVGSHRPSGTPLFESAARAFSRELTAVLLTGMGEDGVSGLSTVHAMGGTILVQSPETCVVPGMPEAAIRAGLPTATLSPDAIAQNIVTRVLREEGTRD